MNILAHRSRRLAPALIVAAVAGGVPAVAGAAESTADDDDVEITVVDEGAPDHRVLLVPPVMSGTMADSMLSFDVDMSMVGSGYPIDIDLVTRGDITRSVEVLAVGADGAYTARETISSFDMTNTSADGTPADPEELGLEGGTTTDLSPLLGVPLVAEYSTDGNLVNVDVEASATVTPEQAELVGELAEGGFGTEGFGGLIPTTPLGEGAVWTVTEAESPGALAVPVAMRFTLVSLKGDDYHIEFTFDGDMAEYLELEEGTEADGDLSLTGTISGDASSAFDQHWTMDMWMDMSFSEDEITIDVDATIRYEHVTTPR